MPDHPGRPSFPLASSACASRECPRQVPFKYPADEADGCTCHNENRPWRRTILKGKNLARETDFLDLYKILGLNPGCELAEFKQAYRRRVAVLHPDRRAGDHSDTIAAERLQQLTALYGAAMEFERRHGRLPGALPVRPAQAEVNPSAAPQLPVAEPPPRRSRWLLVVPATIACIVWLSWDSGWLPGSDESGPAATPPLSAVPDDAASAQREPARPSMLRLGMDADAVRAIEGDPELFSADRWEYGPSWIRFDNGKVADWYSSSLHPLKTAAAHPTHGRD
jgi:curved DNA-binding protein CbpA